MQDKATAKVWLSYRRLWWRELLLANIALPLMLSFADALVAPAWADLYAIISVPLTALWVAAIFAWPILTARFGTLRCNARTLVALAPAISLFAHGTAFLHLPDVPAAALQTLAMKTLAP